MPSCRLHPCSGENENIMQRTQFYPACSPRWCWVVVVWLAIAVLPAGAPFDSEQSLASTPTVPVSARAQSKAEENSNAAEAEVIAPQLKYLAWSQMAPEDKNSISRFLWTPKGRVLSEGEVSKPITNWLAAESREQAGYPQLECLNLFFDVDDRLKNCPVLPTVLVEEKRGRRWTALNSTQGWACSSVSLEKKDFPQWPEKISLEIKYPLEDRTVIKTLKGVPDDTLQVADGVIWYLDSDRARKYDNNTNRWITIEGKTAAVLQTLRGRPEELTDYSVRVYLKDRKRPLDGNYSTLIEPDGQLHEIDVSNPVDPQQIERIEVFRQRFAVRLIENIPIKVDLIPKAE